MTWFDKVKKGAKMILTPAKPKTAISKLSVYPSAKDLNENQIPDMLEQRRAVDSKTFVKPESDIRYDKKGHYVSTMSYPLPPLSWEKKQFNINKKKRNGSNNYI